MAKVYDENFANELKNMSSNQKEATIYFLYDNIGSKDIYSEKERQKTISKNIERRRIK